MPSAMCAMLLWMMNICIMKSNTQHYVAEWATDEGVRIIVARVYVGSKRTSAYVPMPPEHWPDGVPGEVYRRVQEMYSEDDAKEF